MYISFTWLKNFIDFKNNNLDEFIETLTLGGFEVEDFESQDILGKSDIIFDVDTTANRSDTNSIVGFSLEIRNLFNNKINNSKFNKLLNSISSLNYSCFLNPNFTGCSFFYGLKLDNIKIQESPLWLQRRLSGAKISSVNSIVDIGNYIMLEWGQPVHIYDFEKIQSLLKTEKVEIEVRYANDGESFIGLNKQNLNLKPKNLLVTANNTPISIAGILGSGETEVSDSTTSIFVECAIFPSEIIRQSSKACGLRTDAASAYIKGVNPTFLPLAFQRLLSLLVSLSGATFSSGISRIFNQQDSIKIKPIKVRYERIIQVLGPIKPSNKFLDQNTILSCFKQLDFTVINPLESSTKSSDIFWEVIVPSTRIHDLEEEIDIIEEIGRIHGFNTFISSVPLPTKIGKIYSIEILKRQLKSSLINLGLFESVHYSLVPDLKINTEFLLNPFSKDQSNLRSNLLNGLIKSNIQNLEQNSLPLSSFEFGRVFIKNAKDIVSEHELVAGIFGGNQYRSGWYNDSDYETWYEGKAKIEEVFSTLNLSPKWEKIKKPFSSSSFFHPRRTALLSFGETKLGMFGQLHPGIAKDYSISPHIYLFEFDLTNIDYIRDFGNLKQYKKYSYYPVISRDLTFLFSKSVEYEMIVSTIRENGGSFLDLIDLVDTYENKSKEGVSLTFKLQFQSFSNTLVTNEIDQIIKQIETSLENNFSFSL